ncbi:hypothetical protein, conserved [Eimeria tenella]|uniref:Uncharacterized protein n=1 Tax=Eimeria tenella TaxID=5802 RepID=U6L468_EIMTE|nr:hypothetical protein, conserved [Eimeria tenella]CDJ44936.1 hypothetical protein, conserved [Eimeria tenella]|eukprot:XP_013235683.1 hypothetical protein, conserved [Eimeria tenella]
MDCPARGSEAVRVLADAIKRQTARNARVGGALVASKARAYEASELLHAEHLSQLLQGLAADLQAAEAAAEEAQQQIDGERLRHAEAKAQIAADAQQQLQRLQQEEAAALKQQHQAEDKLLQTEAALKAGEEQLEAAREHHKELQRQAAKDENKVLQLIEKDREAAEEEEEAQAAQEESEEAFAFRAPSLSGSVRVFQLFELLEIGRSGP